MNFVDKSAFPERKLEEVSDKYQKSEWKLFILII